MDNDVLRLAFVGDVCLGLLKDSQADAPNFTGWPAIKRKIGDHDFLIGNLECCLVDDRCSDEARNQIMAVPVRAGSFLQEVGFSDLSLANNHSLDCGPEAIRVTRECLASHGIRAFGAGSTLHEAEDAMLVERSGHKVAFLGACDMSEYYASDGRAGIAPLEKTRLVRRVREAAARADLVVVALHADLEFSDAPGSWRRRLARRLIDEGAHLVIQHHPHVLQGIETYRAGVIAYSLGNFIFRLRGNAYQERKAGVFDSLVLVVDADLGGKSPRLTHRFEPLRIGDDHLPQPLTGTSREAALHHVQRLSSLVTDNRAQRSVWFQRCRAEAFGRVSSMYYAGRRGHFGRAARELWRLLTYREDRRWLLGLMSLGYF